MEEYKVSPVQVARIMEKEIGCRYLLETRRHPIPKAEWFLIPELGTKSIKQMTHVYQKKGVIGLLTPFMIDTSAPRESIFQRSGLDMTIVREKYQSGYRMLYEPLRSSHGRTLLFSGVQDDCPRGMRGRQSCERTRTKPA